MAIKHSTRKTTSARRFDTVDLKNGKTLVPIRTEDGEMEYELHYHERFIGFAYDESAARDRLNEYAYDCERGNVEVNDAVAVASAALPFEPTADDIAASEEWAEIVDGLANLSRDELVARLEDARGAAQADGQTSVVAALDRVLAEMPDASADDAPLPFEPRLRYPALPPVVISTLQDGSTVYGSFDNDDTHLTARVETSDRWTLHGDASGLDIWHQDYDFKLDGMTREGLAALKTFVNSGVIEHMLDCATAWDTNAPVPPKQYLSDHDRQTLLRFIDAHFAEQPTPLTIEQKIWPDIDDEVYTSTVYRYGQAEVLVHHDGIPGNLTAYDLVVNHHNMDARDVQGIRDAAILLADARVQAALEVIGLPVPPCPAAPAVQVTRWVEPECGQERGTDYTLGLAEVHIPDNGNAPVLWLRATDGESCPLAMLEPRWWNALTDAAVKQEAAAQPTPRLTKRAA